MTANQLPVVVILVLVMIYTVVRAYKTDTPVIDLAGSLAAEVVLGVFVVAGYTYFTTGRL
jgi:presenilin-like A22 family membrane protease